MKVVRPATAEEAAEAMGHAGAEGQRLRPRGGGTKLGWGRVVAEPDVEVQTGALDRIVEHNAGDLTAVVQAGVPLATLQAALAEAGQMLALDPPVAGAGRAGGGSEADGGATIGGVLATGDSGPLRHCHGGIRDLVLGVTVALSDGTLARAGGRVIKNVAGYDLGKLFAGSFGTLGLVVDVAVRLHPRPARTATVTGRAGDPATLRRGAAALAHAPLEADCLDVTWKDGSGAVLVRFGSADPGARVEEAAGLLRRAGGLEVDVRADDDEGLWDGQRAGQRATVTAEAIGPAARAAAVKVSALPADLPGVLAAAEALSATVVGRAGLGLFWVCLPHGPDGDLVAALEDLRRRLAPAPCVILDAPAAVRQKIDPWGDETGPLELMRRVKARFDPAGVCHPGVFVGGI
ncbi:MAG TPA: FAD-binding oxidoreductase [Acidimicrobiia bacterium]|nr:FAD-binding oxidoreductase [Acidimicrobiia bacterium]